jgi:hypothetical protein
MMIRRYPAIDQPILHLTRKAAQLTAATVGWHAVVDVEGGKEPAYAERRANQPYVRMLRIERHKSLQGFLQATVWQQQDTTPL